MALLSALPDTCHTVRQIDAGPKVYGTPTKQERRGPDIRCRLEDTGSDDTAVDDGGIRRYARRQPNLIIWRKDTTGQPTKIQPGDVLWIDCKELGSGTWRISGRVRIIRKRRAISHFEANVVQVRTSADVNDDERPE